MKTIKSKKLSIILSMVAVLLGACSDKSTTNIPDVMEETAKPEVHVATLTAKLSGDAKSRLSYENGTYNGKNAIFTKWEKNDKLTMAFYTYTGLESYPFTLKEGEGTCNGVFVANNIPNYSSSRWIMYYPGSKITSEKDYLAHNYLGQAQQGNDNLTHLKDYHTIRYVRVFDTPTTFYDEIIDFSGDGFEESTCLKFNMKMNESIVPAKLDLYYMNPSGSVSDIFYTHNRLDSYFPDEEHSYSPNATTTSSMSLALENFESTQTITAYMMMSNYPVTVKGGGKFRLYLTTDNGDKYYGDVNIKEDVTLTGGNLYTISCSSWTKALMIDGLENPEKGVEVLQQANAPGISSGADIIIMGDGFDKEQFGTGNDDYAAIMKQAYHDFFSVEPYQKLSNYFNVYTINAVSEDRHDAVPSGENGATNGDANTVFNTRFTPGSTSIEGNGEAVLQYAMQAIRAKGGPGGTPVADESEVYRRAHTALIMVMSNVKCHAGTCTMSWSYDSDYGNAYSIAYTSLGLTETERRWTTIHEAGGHGFGKLADEYGGYNYTTFSTSEWTKLASEHLYGVNRNINEHWNDVEAQRWPLSDWPQTTTANVYWTELLNPTYNYTSTLEQSGKGEGLGIYRGANTFEELYCRSTENSVMRSQFTTNGHFFNAISRWAIWYRLQQLTGANYTDFKSSFNDFIAFDAGLTIVKDMSESRGVVDYSGYKPLGTPVYVKGSWINGRFVKE